MKKTTIADVKQCVQQCADDLEVWFGKADKVDERSLATMLTEQYLGIYGSYDEHTQDQINLSLEAFTDMVKEQLRERSNLP